MAQALHNRSARKNRPFVAVNCAAISSELVESELFGHEKGAFTGADARRQGRFEAADGGTIFLDEIGDMARETQAKILRVLEEHSFERVGGTRPIDVSVRVVAATHRNLEEEVAKGNFREDLYYRLKVVAIELPSLRERSEDVPALALRFVEEVTERLGREKKQIGEGAMTALVKYPWPGNVRELRNVIEQAVVLAPDPTLVEADLNLPGDNASIRSPESNDSDLPFGDAKKQAVEKFEKRFLLRALRTNNGNISRAAESIGMVRQSLQQKIRELGLRSEDWTNGNSKG